MLFHAHVVLSMLYYALNIYTSHSCVSSCGDVYIYIYIRMEGHKVNSYFIKSVNLESFLTPT